MDRRGFLQTAGRSSMVLVSLPALALPAWADTGDDPTNFHFMSVSTTGPVNGVIHTQVMAGQGEFSGSQVAGGGFYVQWDDVPPAPKPVLASGTWRALEALSFDQAGTYGVQASGILDMRIELLRQLPSPAAPTPTRVGFSRPRACRRSGPWCRRSASPRSAQCRCRRRRLTLVLPVPRPEYRCRSPG